MNAFSKPARVAALAFAIAFPSLVTWVYFDLLADGPPKLQQTAYSIGKAIQFAFPLVWVICFLKQKLKNSGIGEVDVGRKWSARTSYLFGLIVGAAVVTVMSFIYRIFPRSVLDPLQQEAMARVEDFTVDSWQKYLVLSLFYAAVHSFMEEYYFRWFVFGQLRCLTGFLPAMVISGLAFMAHHVIVLAHFFGGISGWTLFLSVSIAVGGWIWAFQYEQAKSLMGPWISHALVDAGIFAIGYHMLFA